LGLTLMLALLGAPAFANGSMTLEIPISAWLGDTQVEKGRYKIAWEEHSPEATITFLKGKQVVATHPGKFVEREKKADRTAVVFRTRADGNEMISEIRIQGSNKVLVFME
jgi:hypothetical protein